MSGKPFTQACEKCGLVPASEVASGYFQGGDRDEILTTDYCACGGEVSECRPAFLSSRRYRVTRAHPHHETIIKGNAA